MVDNEHCYHVHFWANVTSTEGRVLGIIMIVGIGITGAFISTLASGLTRSRTSASSEEDAKKLLQIRLAKGEITRDIYRSAKDVA